MLKYFALFVVLSVSISAQPQRLGPIGQRKVNRQLASDFPERFANQHGISPEQYEYDARRFEAENVPTRPAPAVEERFVPIIPETPNLRGVQNRDREDEDYLRKQAESAHYSFDSQIQDDINNGAITRQETRNGLALKGMYGYSDGFFQRTVHYEADEHGYRIVKEDIKPIGDGPRFNPKGTADVSSSLAGSYSITGDDIRDVRDRDQYNQRREETRQLNKINN